MASEEINQKILEALESLEKQICPMSTHPHRELQRLANLRHSIMGTTETPLDPRRVGIPKKKFDTVGAFNTIFGSHAWAQLNLEANAFGTLPSYPWDKSGWKHIYNRPTLTFDDEEEGKEV